MLQIETYYLDCLLFETVVLELQQSVDDSSLDIWVYIFRVE
jgi:hypothetical protein